MSFEAYKDVWVFIECFDGEPKKVGFELMGQGRKLADDMGQKLCAVIISDDVDKAIRYMQLKMPSIDSILPMRTVKQCWSCAISITQTPY